MYEEINKYVVIDTEQDKLDLINGIYSRLVRVHNSSYFVLLSRSDDINTYTNYSFYKGDPNFNFPDGGYGGCSSSGSLAISDTDVGEAYVNLYAAIVNCNELLAALTLDEDVLLLGEVYFLRAYCYFKLARLFGTPPLVIDTDVNYLLTKPSFAEVYELIEEDLLNSIDLLPANLAVSRIPHESPHVGTAKALLAEVYLAMAGYPIHDNSKYALAAQMAAEVMAQAENYGYELESDLTRITTNSDEYSSEHVFSLFIKNDENDNNSPISATHATGFDGAINITGSIIPEFKYFNTYPDNYRKRIFLKCGDYVNRSLRFPDSTVTILYFQEENPLNNPCSYIDNVGYQKWLKPENIRKIMEISFYDSYSVGHVTIYLLRYAQTLLTYAEARARSGQLDATAYEAVNMIRRRANQCDMNSPSQFDLMPGLSSEQFIDSVVQERAWELCMEVEGRWFDIVRLDLKDKLVPAFRYAFDKPSAFPKTLLTDDWYFFRIPQEDRWNNPNFDY